MRQLLIAKRHVLYPIGCWVILLIYISFIPPGWLIAFIGFYLLLFAAFHTTLLFRFPQKRALLWSVAICTYFILRQFRLDTIPSIVLLIAVAVSLDIFLRPTVRRRFGK